MNGLKAELQITDLRYWPGGTRSMTGMGEGSRLLVALRPRKKMQA